MPESSTVNLAPQFEDAAQQRETAQFGIMGFSRHGSAFLWRLVHGLHFVSASLSRGLCHRQPAHGSALWHAEHRHPVDQQFDDGAGGIRRAQ